MLDQFSKGFKDNYELIDGSYVIAYTFDSKERYGLKVVDTFSEVSSVLLKCNSDVKEIKAKINRMLWISETIVGKWIGIDKRKIELLEVMFMVELQMYMITKATFKFNKEIHERLKTDILTSKLFEKNEE